MSNTTFPLLEAVKNKNRDAVELLLGLGADPNQLTRRKHKPLIYAVNSEDAYIIALLIEHGADVNFKFSSVYSTPLMDAATIGNLEIVKLLVERGADLDDSSRYSARAIHYAGYYGHLDIFQYLFEKHLDREDPRWFKRLFSKWFDGSKGQMRPHILEYVTKHPRYKEIEERASY